MGLTMKARYKDAPEYDFGYGIFFNLRRTIAEEILKDKFYIYTEWLETNRKTPKDVLHKKCEALEKAVGLSVYLFLMQPDSDGKLTLKQVKDIYEKIKDSKANLSLCYEYWHSKERDKDFINLLEDCIEHKCGLKWY